MRRKSRATLSIGTRGAVVNIIDLRPLTRVLDAAVPTLLRTVKQPTFVTINYSDFWRRTPAAEAYCIICLRLPIERAPEVPALLREVLSLPQYRTKRGRMGAVISVRGRTVEDYRA